MKRLLLTAAILLSLVPAARSGDREALENGIFNLGLLSVYARKCGALSPKAKLVMTAAIKSFGPDTWKAGTTKAEALLQVHGHRVFCEVTSQIQSELFSN